MFLIPTQLMPLNQSFWVILQASPEINLADGGPSGGGVGTVLIGVLAVIGAVAVGVVIFLGVRWLRQNVQKPGGMANPTLQALPKETRRLINDAVAKGDYEAAGDLWLRAKMPNDAAEAYIKGKAYLKAARVFQSSDNMAQAIHHYKLGGDYRQAAQLYANDKQHRAAAAEYVQAGELEHAAEQYMLAGDDRRAAEYFEKVKRHLDAARAWERAEQPLNAAQSYALHLEPRFAAVNKGDFEALGADRQIAQKAGNLFKDAGDLERASAMFQRGGFFKEAAECLRFSGDYTRAAEMLIAANQPMLAAQILEEGGEAKRAAKMRAQAALDAEQWEVAAQELQKAGDLERASMLFEKVGQYEPAASLAEELKDYTRACTLFERAELTANAARCAELALNYTLAAELYLKAGDVDSRLRMLELMGDFFQAGQLLYELREYDRALSILERMDSRDPLYPKAIELQGDVVRAQGRFEKAYSRYRAALGTRNADTATLPLFYKMGRVLEEMNDANGAMQNYALVNEIDTHFEDAALRLKALRDRQRRKTTSSGLFSSKDVEEGGHRYEIIEEIARGGMGIVYKAQDTVLGRVVAYKVLGENLRENETALKYFMREAKAAAALSHPNIVTIYDAGEQSGEVYMAMEYVEGTTLKELIRRTGALPNEQVEYIMINCCKALEYAHSKNVIHRDIKSGNVMITRDRTLKVMDFGLAKVLNEYQNNHTQQVGTPFYMSPEQIIGRNVDFRADLYGLGCTLFECATGTVPFFKGDLSYHHLHTKPPTPKSINPALSNRLELAILKLLEKNPDDRYQSASEVLRTYTSARQKA